MKGNFMSTIENQVDKYLKSLEFEEEVQKEVKRAMHRTVRQVAEELLAISLNKEKIKSMFEKSITEELTCYVANSDVIYECEEVHSMLNKYIENHFKEILKKGK